MTDMTPERAKELSKGFILNKDTLLNDFQDHYIAQGFLAGIEYVENNPICDCHTWPTTKELHDYCVALEKKIEDERQAAKGLVKALERIIDDKPLPSHAEKCNSGCVCDEIIAKQELAAYKARTEGTNGKD